MYVCDNSMLYYQTQGVLNLLGAGTVLEFDAGYCNTVVVTGVPYCILLRWDGGGGGVVLLDNTHFDSGCRHKTLMISVKISLTSYLT